MKSNLFLTYLAAGFAAANASSGTLTGDCKAVVSDFDSDDGGEVMVLHCIVHNRYFVVPSVETEWIMEKQHALELVSGETYLSFPEGTTYSESVINTTEEPILVSGGGRRLSSVIGTTGTKKVLVVVIDGEDCDGCSSTRRTVTTETEIQETLFDDSLVNIATQFEACSHGKLDLVPSTYTTTSVDPGTGLAYSNIAAGTTGITTTESSSGGFYVMTNTAVDYPRLVTYMNNVLDQVEAKHGTEYENLADFLMICAPGNTLKDTNAIAWVNDRVSIYNNNNEYCLQVSVTMHELSHNLNLRHSTESGVEYEDQVGYMGYSIAQLHYPQMCFNGAKTNQMGWFEDKTVTLQPNPCNEEIIAISGFVNYDQEDVDNVLLEIDDTTSGVSYFIAYNDASSFNHETQEAANQVTINSQDNEGLADDESDLVAKLDAGGSYTITGFGGVSAGDVLIEVVSIENDVATIKVTAPGSTCVPEVGGDPHITTWAHEHYEFHGQCDLVMAKDEKFANGLGLDVHIRTKLVRYWSYIKNVAIRIGNDILEIEGSSNPEKNEATYWINYEYQGELSEFAGFPVAFETSSLSKSHYVIDLNSKYPGVKIFIKIYKEFVRVKLDGGVEPFGNTSGLLGNFHTGKTLARDGRTVMDDFTEFGQEWQVIPSEPKLFHSSEDPQFPKKCIEPEDPRGDRRRRLKESEISVQQAERACATLKDPLAIKDCVYDILATQDIDMVGAF